MLPEKGVLKKGYVVKCFVMRIVLTNACYCYKNSHERSFCFREKSMNADIGDLPADRVCPVCGAYRSEFQIVNS